MMIRNPLKGTRTIEDRFDEHLVKRGLKSRSEINAARASEGKKPIKE